MCGISGIVSLQQTQQNHLEKKIAVMNQLITHRGPDGEGIWIHSNNKVGFGHKRLSIIDIATGAQPLKSRTGNVITFNGEIYNYLEIKRELQDYLFQTKSDTEVVLAAYEKWGESCVDRLTGMFAFAIWNEKEQSLFCARDQFGIKPFYYAQVGDAFYFASEAKALLPFLSAIETDTRVLKEYLTFQIYLSENTLFKWIKQLLPAHKMKIENGQVKINKYWEVNYNLDFEHDAQYFQTELRGLLSNSVSLHTRSDVPLGSYISGGIDSGIVASLAKQIGGEEVLGFTGKFAEAGALYDESVYARAVADKNGITLHERNITAEDFITSIRKVIYHLDYPVAGPGAFAQYCVSDLASKHRKVLLGGQGGDEIFGGYSRYIVAYFEQCIKAGIEGTLHNGNYVVTYESIIKNLPSLANYKPMIQEFFSSGMFESLDRRYFKLVNRVPAFGNELNWNDLPKDYNAFEVFSEIFNGVNVGKESYFDKMTHFDFKTLLPALLQVEDRMSMAWGIESRVPFLEKNLVTFAATVPADIKFKDGSLKLLLTKTMGDLLPEKVLNRKDKMGFPVPLNQWMKKELREFVGSVFSNPQAQGRGFVDNKKVLQMIETESQFGRTVWGYLSLELWQQEFHDKSSFYKDLLNF